MTIQALLHGAHARNPGTQFAHNADGTIVAFRHTDKGVWIVCAHLGTDGRWYHAVGICVNGKPLVAQSDWIPYTGA